jgi:hypothetical protein
LLTNAYQQHQDVAKLQSACCDHSVLLLLTPCLAPGLPWPLLPAVRPHAAVCARRVHQWVGVPGGRQGDVLDQVQALAGG